MLTMLETVMGEVGQTLRRLAHEWSFATAFVVTLALGIGANGAVFTALDAYFVRPLPYPHAEQLANVYTDSYVLPHMKGIISAYAAELFGKLPGVASWGLYQGGVSGGGVAWNATATVISNGEPKSVGTVSVTASLFKTLDVQPLLGRWIDPSSNRPDGPREVVVSYGFWQSALGGKADAVGQLLDMDGKQYTVVGVMPQSFVFPNRSILLWRPLVLTPTELSPARLTQWNWNMIVRRAPGVSQATLQTELNVWLKRFLAQDPTQVAFKPYIGIIPLREWFGGATGGQLVLMQLGALLLLILAAANLGNLTLVRMLRRRHELGLRVALGASRLALLRLTLTETLPLGIAAAIVGWILSRVGAVVLTHFGVASGQTAFAIGAGGSVGLFSVLLSLIVAFIALSMPLLLIRTRYLSALLQTGGRGTAGDKGSRRSRKGLSIVQIALAIMLLSASTLVGLSLRQMLEHNPGFDPDHLTVATVKLTGPAYKGYEQTLSAWRATQSVVTALPGIQTAGLGVGVPFTGTGSQSAFRVAGGGTPAQNPGLIASVLVADDALPKALDLRLLYGRLLDTADAQGDTYNIVVDAAFARELFGTVNVVGRLVGSNYRTWRIVGVVAPIQDSFVQDSTNNAQGRVIVPPTKTVDYLWGGSSVDIVMRSSLPTQMVTRELQSALARALPGQAITQVSSMQGRIADSVQGTSALATLLVAFGLLAFVLASVGTYGVVAYLTRVRQREFAIRLALGAWPWQIEWLVVAQGVALWAIGAAIGIGFGILLGYFLRGELYGVTLLSPAVYIVPALALGVVVAFASWLPARRVRGVSLTETLNTQ